MKRSAVRLCSAAIALAALLGAAPSPAPSAAALPAPGAVLPIIGHTTSMRGACAVLRDLVAPALLAAMRADAQFGAARKQHAELARYSDGIEADEPSARMALVRFDRTLAAMAQNVKIIADVLGDPRVAEDQRDPQHYDERVALQKIYDVQHAQLAALSDVSENSHFTNLMGDDEDIAHMRSATGTASGGASLPRVLATPRPYQNPAYPTPLPGAIPGPASLGSGSAITPEAFDALTKSSIAGMPPLASLPAETIRREGEAAERIIEIAATCR